MTRPVLMIPPEEWCEQSRQDAIDGGYVPLKAAPGIVMAYTLTAPIEIPEVHGSDLGTKMFRALANAMRFKASEATCWEVFNEFAAILNDPPTP